jgi:hypothetical protein
MYLKHLSFLNLCDSFKINLEKAFNEFYENITIT